MPSKPLRQIGLALLTSACAVVIPVHAAPVTYDITFAGINLPTSGSFQYDAAAAIGAQFGNFIVNFHGTTFDLTSSANNPLVVALQTHQCGQSATSTDAFAMLSGIQQCNPSSGAVWVGTADFGLDIFSFFESSPQTFGPDYIGIDNSQNGVIDLLPFGGHGTFSISAEIGNSVPEPSSLMLLIAAMAAGLLAKAGRRRT